MTSKLLPYANSMTISWQEPTEIDWKIVEDAKAYRKLCDIRKARPGIPCACEFGGEYDDEVVQWCAFHSSIRDKYLEYRFLLKKVILADSELLLSPELQRKIEKTIEEDDLWLECGIKVTDD